MNVGKKNAERRSFLTRVKTEGRENGGQEWIGASKSVGHKDRPSRVKAMRELSIQKEQRWAVRRSITLDADITDSTGSTFAAKITDISDEGCRIRIMAGGYLVRDHLQTIKVTRLEPLTAYVAWSLAGEAGLTFTTPLHPTIVESLLQKSLYARISRSVGQSERSDRHIENLPPFPFE